MSKIKNGGLDQYGAGPFQQQQFATAGVEGVKGRGGRLTSKCDNIRGTSIIVSLKRDEIM